MLNVLPGTLRIYKQFSLIMVILVAGVIYGKVAFALTADEVLNKMNFDERHGYLAGVIEGLAQARWVADKPDDAGYNCIYDWYYKGGKEREELVNTWLNRHPDKSASGLIYVLVKKECGD